MCRLKLIRGQVRGLLLMGVIGLICQNTTAINISDECIQKAPSIKVNSTETFPRVDQGSLVFIFDTTGSMQDKLEEYKAGAQEIVKEFSLRNDNKIFNYILIGFSDPDISAPFITENETEIIQEIEKIEVIPSMNFDCPENALSALTVGLQVALPNSIIYLFTDAPANDFELFENVSEVILKNQIMVNFLVSDTCGQRDHGDDRWKVFKKISNLGFGLSYDLQDKKFNEVLQSIKNEISSKYKILKTFVPEKFRSINTQIEIDSSVSELKFTMAERGTYEIKNPSNIEALTKKVFTTQGVKILQFTNPMEGSWDLTTEADFVTISVISDLEFEFGFSIDIVDDKSQTNPHPISGVANILSIFVPDSSKIKNLSKITLLVTPMNISDWKFVEHGHKLIKHSDELYATNPFALPENPFKIFLEGEDEDEKKIWRTISFNLYKDSGSSPEITIEAKKLEFYEKQNLVLDCNVKSLGPVDIAWTFDGKILESLHSIQSNKLTLNINNITYEQRGSYKCIAVNQVGCETEEIQVRINKIPKLRTTIPSTKMLEDSNYVLTCQLDDITKGREIEYSWFDEDGNLVHNGGNTYSFIPIAEDNNKVIKCQVNCSDFTVESLIKLNINHAPKFLTGLTNNVITYGSKVRFDCSTKENPPKILVEWNFKAIDSTNSITIDGQNRSVFEVQEAFEKDEGEYECVIGNEIGVVRRQFTVLLTPKEPPKITTVKKVVVNETENAKIFCECKNCLPITDYSWTFHNSRQYEVQWGQNEKENYFNTFIILNNTDEFDTGNFVCQITNSKGQDNATVNLKVQMAASVEKILLKSENEREIDGSLNILEGENLTLECIGNGETPTVSWFKNNKKLSDDSILIISNATVDDEGEFECIVENVVKIARKSIQMDINFLPKAKGEANIEYLVSEEDEAILTCEIIGKPEPKIVWYLNSKQIDENDKCIISGNTLKFIAEPQDSGLYKCKGINEFGSTEIGFTVKVKSFPRILSPNDELVKAEINSKLELSCDAIGFPAPEYKFVKNNVEVFNGSRFIIESVNPSDAGSYHCFAENEAKSVEKIFYVSVVQKPLISSFFNNITLYTNQSKRLTCEAKAIPEPNFKWKLNNKELLSKEKFINLDSDFESGKISCIAENSEGITERYFYLEVINIPKLHSLANELQTNITIREGDDLELLCPVENYSIIKWTHNGSPFKVPDFRQVDKKLIVYNTKKSNSGLWTCSAYHTKNSTDFSYKVVVLSPPVVLASWNINSTITDFDKNDVDIDQKVFWKGESLLLNCTADGNPLPNVEWRKGSVLISRGEVLSIENLQLFHSDIYSCLVENKHGMVKKYFKVDILSGPHVEDSSKVINNYYGSSGETVIIKCPIIGNPVPLFSWYKEKELLEDEIEDFLILDNLKLSDERNYRCLARNKYGRQNISFDLTINEPVKILKAVELEKVKNDDEFVTLSCVIEAQPVPVISWILNGRILSTTSKVKINEVLNATSNNFLYFDGNGNGIAYSDPSGLNISNRAHFSKLTKLHKKSLQLDLIIRNNKENLHLKKFYCNTFNALGQDERSVETVYNQKPYIEQQYMPKQTKYEILEHLPLQMSCMFDGFPVPGISWYKDEIQIFENDTIKFVNDGKMLNIPETESWLTGNYTCVGSNAIGIMQLTFNVLILSPPRIVSTKKISDFSRESFMPEEKETIEVIRGDDITLECLINASPKAKIHWVEITGFGSYNRRILSNEESSLTIHSVEEDKIYQCYANNTVGFIQKTFNLLVFYPPEFNDNKSLDENLIVKLHHELKLECKVDAYPEPETYWSFNSENITSFDYGRYLLSNNQILRIINANKRSEGKFTCTSFNRFGQIQKNFNIKIDIPIEYSKWSKWSECSEFCGTKGTKFRTRTCILLDEIPIPYDNCTGDILEVSKCNEFPCPINGGFSSWSNWSECPSCYDVVKAEIPKQTRSRTCDSPKPDFGGLNCIGYRTEERECEINPCSIDGGWSSWSEWSKCPKNACYDSLKLEKPKQYRTRLCNSPVPAHNGLECQGSDTEEQDCDIVPCPINGNWGNWSNWSVCPPCYNEYEQVPKQTKIRKCDSPSPQYGGLKCKGIDREHQDCKEMKFCPIDGGWSRWSDWSGCLSSVNGHGIQYRVRYCTNPKPKYNGSNCIGLPQEKRSCEVISCDGDETVEAVNTRTQRLALSQYSSKFGNDLRCGRGYKPYLNSRCVDIDECRECSTKKLCNKNEICINSIGSYRCRELY